VRWGIKAGKLGGERCARNGVARKRVQGSGWRKTGVKMEGGRRTEEEEIGEIR